MAVAAAVAVCMVVSVWLCFYVRVGVAASGCDAVYGRLKPMCDHGPGSGSGSGQSSTPACLDACRVPHSVQLR